MWDSDALAPVHAPGNGVVTFAGLLPSTWGNVVVIKHSTNPVVYSRAAHLDSIAVKTGDAVAKEQYIGNVGNAFGQLPYHLHYDLSLTNILESIPGHWPGGNLDLVKRHYVEPRALTLVIQAGPTSHNMIVKSPANFRAGPGVSFRVYETLQTGGWVTSLGVVDNYHLVRRGQDHGFIHDSLLVEPTGTGLDMAPYIKGDGRLYEVINEWGSQQRHQSQSGQGNEFFQTKDSDWEQMFSTSDYIVRDIDSSPGGGRYYRLKEGDSWGSAWIPRTWSIGDVFTRSRYVQFFKEQGCVPDPNNSGGVTDTMRFVAHHDNYAFQTGLVIQDVVELEWVNGPERYFYARNYGLVGWRRLHDDPNTPEWSAISEEHAPGTRPDNLRKVIDCLD